MNSINVVRVVIQDSKGRILLLKRASSQKWPNRWSLPGGKINEGESAKEACRREIKEETGLLLDSLEFLFFSENLTETDANNKKYIISYFLGKSSGKVNINKESSQYEWVAPKEIGTLDVAFMQQKVIKRFLSVLARK